MSFRLVYLLTSLLAVATLMVACGGSTPKEVQDAKLAAGIMGGKLANDPIDEGYWSVAQLDLDGATCSGVLIGRDVVLTAAHCVSDFDAVKLGLVIFPQSGGEEFQIRKVVVHPKFKSTSGYDENFYSVGTNVNDLAVLLLTKPVELPLNAVTLPSSSFRAQGPLKLRTYGFGRTTSTAQMEPQLRYVDKVGSPNLANGRFEFTRDGKGACLGDSGGPSFMNGNELMALTSYGIGFNKYATEKCGVTNHAMWIPSHLLWIQKVLRDLGK